MKVRFIVFATAMILASAMFAGGSAAAPLVAPGAAAIQDMVSDALQLVAQKKKAPQSKARTMCPSGSCDCDFECIDFCGSGRCPCPRLTALKKACEKACIRCRF
jgi:hypothetical protein